jgi:hypothetical protein
VKLKLTPSRFRVLELIEDRGQLHQDELAIAFAKRPMSPAAATRFSSYLCKLAAAGLIGEIDFGRYQLTPAGARTLWGYRYTHGGWDQVAGIMDDIPQWAGVQDLLPPLWVLDANHQPVRAKSWREWCEWMATEGHHVAFGQVGDMTVSTVFLTGSVHPFLPKGQFETMIFGGGELDNWQHRWASWDEAVLGHQAALALARAKLH